MTSYSAARIRDLRAKQREIARERFAADAHERQARLHLVAAAGMAAHGLEPEAAPIPAYDAYADPLPARPRPGYVMAVFVGFGLGFVSALALVGML